MIALGGGSSDDSSDDLDEEKGFNLMMAIIFALATGLCFSL
jgi:hypothetical protein